MNLGVIGLGMIGRAMARNLLRAGHRVMSSAHWTGRAEKPDGRTPIASF